MNSDHVVCRNGEVVHGNDRIVFGGHGYSGPVDRAVDPGDASIRPGFVDADALADIDHGALNTFRPAELALGLQWSEDDFRTRRRDGFSARQEAFKRRSALVRILLNGISTAMPIGAETYKRWQRAPTVRPPSPATRHRASSACSFHGQRAPQACGRAGGGHRTERGLARGGSRGCSVRDFT
jgi:cytosine/adenosine deaminase-related metal-dependent hydrolase